MTAASDTPTVESDQPIKAARSRRAVLAGAFGGLAAIAASVVGRPSRALGADGDNLILGQENTATTFTRLENTTDASDATAFIGRSNSGIGLRGRSVTGQGVQGFSSSSAGVQGFSDTDAGVNGFGVFGVWAAGSEFGVNARGPVGIYGEGDTAGYFAGKVYTTQFYELEKISDPGAPDADKARIFLRDNAQGKAQLCVRFDSGAVQVIATHP